MARLLLGNRAVDALAVRALSADEWQQARRMEETDSFDRLFFRLPDGVVYEALFTMDTHLTTLVKQAYEGGRLAIEYAGQRGRFLLSEDLDSFEHRMPHVPLA